MGRLNLDKLRSHIVKSAKSDGLPIPQAIENNKSFPADITRLSDGQLRKQMSYWSAQLARAEFVKARAEVTEIGAKESVKRAEQRFRILNPTDAKWKGEAELARDESYRNMKDKLTQATAFYVLVKGLVDSYERYWNALSRELAARISEKDRDLRDRPQ